MPITEKEIINCKVDSDTIREDIKVTNQEVQDLQREIDKRIVFNEKLNAILKYREQNRIQK
jgi:hypothetical protein